MLNYLKTKPFILHFFFLLALFGTKKMVAQDLVKLTHYYQIQDFKAARNYLEQVKKDTSVNWQREYAYTCLMQKDYKTAESVYLRLTDLDTKNASSYLTTLGTIAQRKGQNQIAFTHFSKALNRNDGNKLYLYQQLASVTDSAELKIDFLTKAHELAPTDGDIALELATLYENETKYSQAYTILNTAYTKDSTNMLIAQELVTVTYSIEDYPQVIELAKRIFSTSFDKQTLWKYSSKAQFKLKNYQAVIDTLQRLEAVEIDHKLNENDSYLMATAYFNLKQYANSNTYYENAIKQGISNNIDYYYAQLVEINCAQKQYQKALANIQKALFFKVDPYLVYLQASIYDYNLKKPAIARKYYQQFLKLKPSEKDYAEQIAYAKKRLNSKQPTL